ncbi:hypothetical protein [Priestia abyssalis]|uniref:hypothetical protein n=1 Tax=Priestia abyssalis TaxID=1221450 RepID=UPI000994D07F|nr:hypothetical protein [Priestia abyssalis]
MNNQKDVLELLDSPTISALLKIYDIQYSALAFKFHCSKQNIVYLMKHDAFKDYQRQLIYELFKSYGMEDLELFLIHHLLHKKG